MISRLPLPSAVRLATYSLVLWQDAIRTRTTECMAWLALRSPPLLSRWRVDFPDEAGMGATPTSEANCASFPRRSGLSPKDSWRSPSQTHRDYLTQLVTWGYVDRTKSVSFWTANGRRSHGYGCAES